MEIIHKRNLLPEEKYREAESRLETLKEKLFALKQEYPSKESIPPEEIRKELLKELNILE